MKLLRLLAVFVLAVTFLPASGAHAEAKYVFKLAHTYPEGKFNFHVAALELKEKVEKYTNGQVEIVIYPGAVLGTDYNVVKKIQNGAVELEIMAIQQLSGYYPKIDVLSLPFLFDSFESFIRVRKHQVFSDLAAEMEKNTGVRMLACVGMSFRHFTNNRRPVNSLEDMKGLKIRVPQNKVCIAYINALGASPAAMPTTELFSALQQGVVDGQDMTLGSAIPNKIYEVQDHMALTYHQLSGTALIMSARKYNSLPQDIREAFDRASAELEVNWQQRCIEEENELLATWRANKSAITTPDLKPFVQATERLYEEFAPTVGGSEFVKLVQSIAKGE